MKINLGLEKQKKKPQRKPPKRKVKRRRNLVKVTPDIIRHEFIGTEGKIAKSQHAGYVGIYGEVIDETKNTFTILQKGKAKSVEKNLQRQGLSFPWNAVCERSRFGRSRRYRENGKNSCCGTRVPSILT